MYKIVLILLLVFVHVYAQKYYGSVKVGYSSIANSKISKSGQKKDIESSYEPQFDIRSIAVGMFHKRYVFEVEYNTDTFTQKEQMWSENSEKYTANDVGDSNALELQTLFANAYYYPKYKLYGAMPYVGGGIGIVNMKLVAVYDYGAYNESSKNTTMAGHISGGFIKKYDRDMYFGAGARLVKYMSVKYKDSDGVDMTYEPGLSGSLYVDVRILF